MSINNFIPAVWTAEILANLNNDHVFAKCCNRDYEGEITGFGSSVKINSIGRITISSYTRDTDISDPETVDDAGQSLLIDQAKYYNFAVDDVDEAQAKGNVMSAAMGEASWGLAETVDDFLATTMNAAVAMANTLTSVTVGTGPGESDAYGILIQMRVALNELNVPKNNRWVIVPQYFEGMLLLDQRVTSFGTPANRANYRGDPLGTAAGFTIYTSNNTPSGNTVIAGYPGAVTFAEQIVKTEAYRPQKRFSDAVKGLHVYGAKVTRPDGLAKVVVTEGTY